MSLPARKRAALAEFAAIARDVATLPGRRDVTWWTEVRDAVCAKHDVPDLIVRGPAPVPIQRLLARRWAS